MGILGRLFGKASQRSVIPRDEVFSFVREARAVWLPGEVEVQVAGESYHGKAILAAQLAAHESGQFVAVLVPEPANPHDLYAVAILVNGQHVGYIHADVARRVQPALLDFARIHEGRPVSCPAELRQHDIGPQIVLLLNPEPLGLTLETFDVVPDLARELARLFLRLDTSPPVLDGFDGEDRAALAEAEKRWTAVEADYGRDQNAWPRVEHTFRGLVEQLTRSQDPLVSAAWLGLARSVRYQAGHRDETLAAYIGALYYDRANEDAWWEFVEYSSAAPHVPTLVEIFGRIPFGSRQRTLELILSIAAGGGRLGNVSPRQGARLRTAILNLITFQDDVESTAYLTGRNGLRAERDGNIDTAVSEWRRAIAAGSTDGRVADRYSVWLTKHRQFDEAAGVLNQALAHPPQHPALRDRMERRLLRCEHEMAKAEKRLDAQ